jgi:hypothetical protein
MRELIVDFNSHATPTRVVGKRLITGFDPRKA